MKLIKFIFFITWTGFCFIGISKNSKHYSFIDWVIVILFCLIPYLVIYLLTKRKRNKLIINNLDTTDNISTSYVQNTNTSTNVQDKITKIKEDIDVVTPSPKQTDPVTISQSEAINKLNTAQEMLNSSLRQLDNLISSGNILEVFDNTQNNTIVSKNIEPPIQYIESNNIIMHTNKQPITDEEIPYLIKVGYDATNAKMQISTLVKKVQESHQIMYNTTSPETLCSRYNYAKNIVNELQYFYQQGFYNNIEVLEKCKEFVSDRNYCKLIIQCYNKYMQKAYAELKTANGIEKRRQKFLNYIKQNVNTQILLNLSIF